MPESGKVDLKTLNQVDQEHQIPQNLGDTISERLGSVIKNASYMNEKKLAMLKNFMKNYWLLITDSKIVEKYLTPKFKKEIFCNNKIPVWVKSADKRSLNWQALVVKATACIIKLCGDLLKAEKVVNTKDLMSTAMDLIMLLGHVNFSMRSDGIKNSL